jgi:hypothetical protein
MLLGHKVFAITLMREGSKRLPQKHFMDINGRPMCHYAIDAAKACENIDFVGVSTSSKEYARLLDGYVDVIPRDTEFDADNLHTLSILKHVASQIPAKRDDIILYFDCTMPLTKRFYFSEVLMSMEINDLHSCFTVKRLRYALVGDPPTSSQARPPRYIIFGAVRGWKYHALLNADENTWGESSLHCDIPIVNDNDIDVNNMADFVTAEALIKARF